MVIQHTVTINKPLQEVETFLIEVSNNSIWQEDVTEAGTTTEGPVGKGTKAFENRNFMHLSFRTEWEVTEYTPGKSFSFASTSSIAPYEGTFMLEPEGDGTKVTFSFTIHASGFNGLFDPVMNSVFAPRFHSNLERLAAILEQK